ncbi:hypothetical protein BH20ACT15_BH20ACT15_14530 [soil metagenome]
MPNKKKGTKGKSTQETVHVGLLIDETRSMTGNEASVIGGANEFIEGLPVVGIIRKMSRQDAWAVGQTIGVAAPGRAFDYDASPEGTAAAMRLSSDRVQSFRSSRRTYEAEAEELGRRRPR